MWQRSHIKRLLEAAASPEMRDTAVGGGRRRVPARAVTQVPGAELGDGKNECGEVQPRRLLYGKADVKC